MQSLSELPFFNLTNEEFLKETGTWLYHSSSSLFNSKDLFRDVIENPDKANEEVGNGEFIESRYFTIKQVRSRISCIKNKGFSLMHFNIRSLSKNLTLINDLLLTLNDQPDIIALSETRLTENSYHNISLPGYKFLGQHSKTSAGGVGFYISDHIQFSRRNDLDFKMIDGLESCWIEIPRQKQTNIVIGCLYRHPSQSQPNRTRFYDALKVTLEKLNNERCEVLITGDINIDLYKYTVDNDTSDYLDMLLNLGFLPIITKATRITDHSATLIDHIYTNFPHKVSRTGICAADITDHLPIFCTVVNKLPSINERKFCRDFSNFNSEMYIYDLSNINFNDLVSSDVNDSMDKIINKLKVITDKHAPVKKMSRSKQRLSKRPWLTNCLIVSIKKRQKMFKTHFLSKDQNKVKYYKTYNNKLNRLKEAAKKNYFSTQFNIHKDCLKTTWKLIGMIISRRKKTSPPITNLLYNNKCYTNKKDICEQLNLHFVNVGPKLAAQIPTPANPDPKQYIKQSFVNSFMFRAINVCEVRDSILSMKVGKASIGIPRKCIKLAIDHISEALTSVYNLSIQQGIVPDVLKISRITPVDKGGEITDPSNFRPISTLSCFAQILEKLVYKQLINYIEKYQILNEFQFGFRKGRSTEQALAEITENLKNAIDNNVFTCGVFLDFAKAFDTVDHKILLTKLQAYGIRGIPLEWFTSYLYHRKQYVSLNGLESTKQTVVCGVPQGSSLGPLLFLIYINDIPNSSDKLNFRLFADDTNVFASSASAVNLECIVNDELTKVKKWCDINKLSLNIKKTHYMIIKSRQKKSPHNFNIKITNNNGTFNQLERKAHVKYLGVLIDESISWKHHVAYICSRIARNTGIFYKLRHYMSLSQLKQLYYNLIFPLISYAILAWGSAYQSQINKVQVKQNTVIRVMFFAVTHGKNTESALPLMNLLNILSVKSVHQLQTLKFAFCWHKKELPKIFQDYFQYADQVHNYNTRYSIKKNFYKPRTRTNIGKQSIQSIAVDLWKGLPHHLKNLPNFSFPRLLKQHLLTRQFES